MQLNINYERQILELFEACRQLISDVKPSAWAEGRRVMSSEVSPFPGPYTYNRTPYLKEIVDCLDPAHPARRIAVMKGAQIGFSAGVIENGIGWIISECPGPIMFLSGAPELSEEAMDLRIDQMIESCGIRHLIRPNIIKKKNARSGDTRKSKEFPGGFLIAGAAGSYKLMRQRSIRYAFVDDFDAAKASSEQAGSNEKLIEQRCAAFGDKMKIMYSSSPELEDSSNINSVFLKGDQRYFNIPCPCCGAMIALHWTVEIKGTEGREKAGMYWKDDERGRLIPDSVGYICQECGNFFDDSQKGELMLAGEWIPTVEPSQIGYYSYHISSLYAPAGMYDWAHYVREYKEAYPKDGPGKESLKKTFMNLGQGLPWKPEAEDIKANDLQRYNIRTYPIGTVPERFSQSDGNGSIVLLTCAADLNGLETDARVDWEVVAWSESGSSYSVEHGSIGTFIPLENQKRRRDEAREKWTYEWGRPLSVWPELKKILDRKFPTDTGRNMGILMAGVDSGRFTTYAYSFIDSMKNVFRVALKGKDEAKPMKLGADLPNFKPARERSNLYLVEVNAIKDDLADYMRLKWDDFSEEKQPPGYLNYPQPGQGLYGFNNFFSHYEAEHKITEKKNDEGIGTRWVKRSTKSQNHFWDVRIYNMVLKDIVVNLVCKSMKEFKGVKPSWGDFVSLFLGKK
jgi:phage terminase large subunit GpA-like protein